MEYPVSQIAHQGCWLGQEGTLCDPVPEQGLTSAQRLVLQPEKRKTAGWPVKSAVWVQAGLACYLAPGPWLLPGCMGLGLGTQRGK
jgi:hypothetical protein